MFAERGYLGVEMDFNDVDQQIRPVLKWAGGKQQLLSELLSVVPRSFGSYYEPFFGGGALYFALKPTSAIISDSNPELINLYRAIKRSPAKVYSKATSWTVSERSYYRVRDESGDHLDSITAAARTLYLNKTCFNGLFRVNRDGQFNVPFGKRSSPIGVDRENLALASKQLKLATIRRCDYREALFPVAKAHRRVSRSDLVFLDPPYLPISKYADFKRYTKEQFYEDDHRRLAEAVHEAVDIGATVILTNSNHPLVHELFSDYEIHVVQTRRNISSVGASRRGEDVIVVARPKTKRQSIRSPRKEDKVMSQVSKYPLTRYMGSKRKLLADILHALRDEDYETVLDPFSGSGVVGYLFKAAGKKVICNDQMTFCSILAKAMIENDEVVLSRDKAVSLTEARSQPDSFAYDTYKGIFLTPDDLRTVDVIRANIARMRNPYEQAIAMASLVRACMKKQPRGIFTYVGRRYDDGRADLKVTMRKAFLSAVEDVNSAVFTGSGRCAALNGDALSVNRKVDLVYLDPPYYSPLSDNDYVRRYHFVEGMAIGWKGVKIQADTKTRKFKTYPTPFGTLAGTKDALQRLISRYRDSTIVMSYSSNSLPTKEELVALLSRYKRDVEVVDIAHRYHFGNKQTKAGGTGRNKVSEYIFVAR